MPTSGNLIPMGREICGCHHGCLVGAGGRRLEYEDCQWVFEGGMPMPDYGVTVGQSGLWHSGISPFPEEPEARGEDLQSFFDYLIEKGLVKK